MRRKGRFNIQLTLTIFIGLAAIILFVFVPPTNPFVIALMILLLTSLSFAAGTMVLKQKLAILFSIFVAALLIMGYLQILDIINFSLLTSLLIGIFILFK